MHPWGPCGRSYSLGSCREPLSAHDNLQCHEELLCMWYSVILASRSVAFRGCLLHAPSQSSHGLHRKQGAGYEARRLGFCIGTPVVLRPCVAVILAQVSIESCCLCLGAM